MTVDPENPRDLRGAPLTLSGAVHATAAGTVLATSTGRWLLLGRGVDALVDGAVAVVRGRPAALPAALPAGIDADRAFTVQRIG